MLSYSTSWAPLSGIISSLNELERSTLRLLEIILYGLITSGFYLFLSWLLSVANKKIIEKHPTQKFDDFYKDNGHSYDFVFVFEVVEDDDKENLSEFQTKYSLKNILDRLTFSQFECVCFYSCQRDEIYIKMRVSIKTLKDKAAGSNYKLCLDSEKVKLRLEAGSDSWAPVKIMDQYKVSPFSPFEYIYGKYDLGEEYQALYKLYEVEVIDEEGEAHDFDEPFRSTDRIKLIISILESKVTDSPPGCGLSVNDLLHKEAVLAAFPLHDYTILKDIQKKWLKLHAWPSSQPISEIKDYFGERVGLYFAYLQHYVTWLMYPALFGVGTFTYGAYFYTSKVNQLLPVYTIFMVFWSTFYIEAWKNRQATIAMIWGMTGFEDEETDRPQFFGDTITDIITGEDMTYFPDDLRRPRDALAAFVQILFVLLCLMSVIGVYGLQWEVLSMEDINTLLTALRIGSSGFALLNSVFIRIISYLWRIVAIRLNNHQNHRTDTDYEDSLVAKVFFVEIFNYNAGLFYVAFVKSFLGFNCVNNDCAGDASATVASLTLLNLITRAYVQVIARMNAQKSKDEEESSGLEPGVEPSPIEQQYTLSEYSTRDTFDDYCSLILQYGYCTLIVGAYPLSSYWAFVSSYIQIRIDGWKLCQAHTRPRPLAAEDMGQWQNMLEILGACSVLTNAALICIVSSYFTNISKELRWILFIVVEHAMFAIKYFVGEILPDVPEEVEMQLARQDFIISKVLANEGDEDEEEMEVQKDNTIPEIDKTDRDWDGLETEKEEVPEEE